MARALVLLFLLLVGAFLYSTNGIRPEAGVVSLEGSGANVSAVNIVGIDEQGRGVMARLEVRATPGSGNVMINIDEVLFLADTQQSIRNARLVAERYANRTADYVYEIKDIAATAGGPSAGLPLAMATIAALENKTIPEDVSMTGTIAPDGSVGKVGGVGQKARAARENGIRRFYVPEGEGDVKEEGLTIIEVNDINEAARLILR